MKQSVLASIALGVCLALVLPAVAQAAKLEYYGVEDSIGRDMSVHSTVIMKFSEAVGHMEYGVGFGIYNFTASASFPFAECSQAQANSGTVISCDFVGMSLENNRLTLGFDTLESVTEKGGVYRFVTKHDVPMPVESAFIVVKLPENGILSEPVANQSYYPQDGGTASDGRHIIVYWERNNVTDSEAMRFSVLYTAPAFRSQLLNYMVLLVAVVVIAVMGIAFYVKIGRRLRKAEIIESVLNKDERAVVSVLNKHGGKVGQKFIVREAGFSKAKVSRLVKAMKDRGVIDIEPVSGRENRILLRTSKEKPGQDAAQQPK